MRYFLITFNVSFAIIVIAIINTAMANSLKIPIPPPFSGHDAKKFEAAIVALDNGRYSEAMEINSKITDNSAREIIEWLTYTEKFSFPSFEEISSFINTHADWPLQKHLLHTADRALAVKLDDKPVIEWYKWRDPVSKNGRLRLADALLNQGKEDLATDYIRKSWHLDYYSKQDLLTTEEKYRKFIRSKDHQIRLDQLLWDNKRKQAKQMFRFVKSKYKNLAIARLTLRNSHKGVDAAISNVSQELKNNAGLQYERLRWRRKKGKHDSARSILLFPPDNLVRPKFWWKEREIQIRKLLDSGDYETAYFLAAEHGQMHAGTFSQAEWLSGWISLRMLNEPLLAINHFSSIYDTVFMPISRARSSYWSGKAASAAGDKLMAEKWFNRAASYCTTFYGQLATEILKQNDYFVPKCLEQKDSSKTNNSKLQNHSLFSAARRLAFIGKDKLVHTIILKLGELAKTADDFALIASLTDEIQRPDLSIAAAKRASRDGYHNEEYLFPVPNIPFALPDNKLEYALVMAVIRQESQFYSNAVSRAGARGLMQLMPKTALSVAKNHKLIFSKLLLTRDASYNIKLGSEYLYSLINKYNGAYALALAAYNAGPGNLSRWIKNYGDPRVDNKVDMIDWLEKIPFYETRNYVQRVLESLQVYRRLMKQGKSANNIKMDLERGFHSSIKLSK